MNEDKMMIPYIVYESAEAKHERTVKRLVVALAIAIVLIFASNALWLNAWMQYDYSDETVEIDAGGGIANYVGNDGDITNGEDYGTEEDKSSENR